MTSSDKSESAQRGEPSPPQETGQIAGEDGHTAAVMDPCCPNFISARRNIPSKCFRWILHEEVFNILGFIGGFVDAAGYLKFYGLFTASITGNLVAAVASVYSPYGVVSRVFVTLGFVLGVYLTSLAQVKLKLIFKWDSRANVALAFAAEIMFMGLAIGIGMVYDSIFDENEDIVLLSWQLILVSTIISLAMGIQNSGVKDNFSDVPSTTVITMLLVTVSSQSAHVTAYALHGLCCHCNDLFPADSADTENQLYQDVITQKRNEIAKKWFTSLRQLASFLIGGLAGSVLMYNISFYCFFVVIGLLTFLLLDLVIAAVYERKEEQKSLKHHSHLVETDERTEQQSIEEKASNFEESLNKV